MRVSFNEEANVFVPDNLSTQERKKMWTHAVRTQQRQCNLNIRVERRPFDTHRLTLLLTIDRQPTYLMTQMLTLKARRERRNVEIVFILLQSWNMLYWTVTKVTIVWRSSRSADDWFAHLFDASLMNTAHWKKWDLPIPSVYAECHRFVPRRMLSWLNNVPNHRLSCWLKHIIAIRSNVKTTTTTNAYKNLYKKPCYRLLSQNTSGRQLRHHLFVNTVHKWMRCQCSEHNQ